MNCPRCKKDFHTEPISFLKWLETAGFDALQTAYVICCSDGPLFNECLETLKSGFYTCKVNPYLKTR